MTVPPVRVVAFVDGFNLYHAIDELGQRHLKWLNLRVLCSQFAPAPQYRLTDVLYFSAYATWRPAAYARHRRYVRALRAVGVTTIMGTFKPKVRFCRRCRHRWRDHEEKETDVNIALHLYRGATRGMYDRALLVSGDSDLAPAVRLIRADVPAAQVRVVAPVGRGYSMDLYNAAGGKAACVKMKRIHVERALFGAQVYDSDRNLVAVRPVEYDPPSS